MTEPSGGGDERIASEPSSLRSWYDLQRYRARLVRYSFVYARRPDPATAAGLVLGALGIVTLVAGTVAVVVLLVGAGLATAVLVLMLSAPLVSSYVRRTQPRRVFAAAVRSGRVDVLQQDSAEGMANDAAYRALERLYAPLAGSPGSEGDAPGWSLPGTPGRRPLVLVRPAPPGQTLATLLDPDLAARPPAARRRARRSASERMAFVQALRRQRAGCGPIRDDESGDNLVLDRMHVDPETEQVRMTASLASYGEIMRTCDAALNEFALFAHLGADRRDELSGVGRWCAARLPGLRLGQAVDLLPGHTLRCLPWRRAAHGSGPLGEGLLTSPAARAAGVGVAVVMVDSSDNRPRALVARRSAVVGTYPGAMHVLPAGMCNAKEDLRDRGVVPEGFLEWTMLGELLEECYDEEELSAYRTEDWAALVRQKLAQRRLEARAPTFTGLAVDLLTLRPEVCATVEARPTPREDDGQRLRLCWEYDPNVAARRIDLTSGEDLDRTNWVQSGIGSLVLAARSAARRADPVPEAQGSG